MFSKVKCPTCGAKNDKERISCNSCGSSLDYSQTKVTQESKSRPTGTKKVFQNLVKALDITGTAHPDTKTDQLCSDLLYIGLEAHVATQIEEHFGWDWKRITRGIASGLIEIPHSPIHWVVEEAHRSSYGGGISYSYSYFYMVTDPTLNREMPPMFIRVIGKPLGFGPTERLCWEGSFNTSFTEATVEGASQNQGVIKLNEALRRLNEDEVLNQSLIRLDGFDFENNIQSYPEYGYWRMEPAQSYHFEWPRGWGNLDAYRELWDCWQKIAQHLLGDWKTT